MTVSASELEKTVLAEKMAGDIVLSQSPGGAIRKWRNFLKIAQKDLSKKMGITQSVISDYESGRRKSPGIGMIKKIVESMLEIEASRGNSLVKELIPETGSIVNAILDIKEFTEPMSSEKFCKAASFELVGSADAKKELHGYTIIDSLVAIVNMPPSELVKIYGSNTNRALIFTKVSTGRSPMVAIKVTGIKPGLVVIQGSEKIDEIAVKIADAEGIPIAISKEKSVESLIASLKKTFA
jgi:putative transcriptional regulator